MNKIAQLSRTMDSRLRRIERDMGASDAWLTRLMAAPTRQVKGQARDALTRLLSRWGTGRG